MWPTLVLSFLKSHWKAILIGGLLTTNVFTIGEWRHTDAQFRQERAAHTADIVSFKDAQRIADTNAQNKRDELLKESKANATKADQSYSDLLAKYKSSLLRYQANQSGASQSDNYQLPTPQGGNGSGSSPDLLGSSVTITGSDAQICAVNTARLVAVHDWAIGLPK